MDDGALPERPRLVRCLLTIGLASAAVAIVLPTADASAAQATTTLVINGPARSQDFGNSTLVLSNGNFAVTDPPFDGAASDSGAVYLYDGSDDHLIGRMSRQRRTSTTQRDSPSPTSSSPRSAPTAPSVCSPRHRHISSPTCSGTSRRRPRSRPSARRACSTPAPTHRPPTEVRRCDRRRLRDGVPVWDRSAACVEPRPRQWSDHPERCDRSDRVRRRRAPVQQPTNAVDRRCRWPLPVGESRCCRRTRGRFRPATTTPCAGRSRRAHRRCRPSGRPPPRHPSGCRSPGTARSSRTSR